MMIYLVEDDENIRALVIYALKAAGFEAEGFPAAKEFWKALRARTPDLCLLDIMLPVVDGLAILESIRKTPETATLPVVLLTAKGSELDRVQGLDLGADDYIAKPFSVLELISRVRAVLRRFTPAPSVPILQHENVVLFPEKRVVEVDGAPTDLTYKEFEVLQLFLRNKGIVLTRDRLLAAVWGVDFSGETRTVDMHIKTLRQKLGTAGECIQTVRGVGYKIN